MERINYLFLIVLLSCLFTGLSSCDDSPVFPSQPKVGYIDITPREVQEGDSVLVTFRFQDGDGDLGSSSNEDGNLVLFDSRAIEGRVPLNLGENAYSLPSLTPDAKNPSIQGELTVMLSFMVRLPDVPANEPDSVRFQIILTDRAGNVATPIEGNDERIWTDYVYIYP
jgi:hypothetical protein